MSIKVFAYKQGSRSARALADALGGRVLRRENSRYRYREGDLIVNWGAGDCPFTGRHVVNQPNSIGPASNKLSFFRMMTEAGGVNIPNFWTRREDIPDDAFPIMCRTTLTGHSGAGIVIAETREQLVAAPLYTQYMKKKDEYRVHVMRGRDGTQSIIAEQRKAKRAGADEVNHRVRNLANGFVYVRQGFVTPEGVINQAKAALMASGLAFGAVDVIYNEYHNLATVLEINTAPGLEGQTVTDYANAFRLLA